MIPDELRLRCLRFDRPVYETALVKMQSAPLTLTEDELEQCGIVSAQLEAEAREARRLAKLHATPRC